MDKQDAKAGALKLAIHALAEIHDCKPAIAKKAGVAWDSDDEHESIMDGIIDLNMELSTRLRALQDDVFLDRLDAAAAEPQTRQACDHENGFEDGICGECGLYRRSEDFG